MSIKETEEGLILEVYVKPKSREFSIKFEGDSIVVNCMAPPAKGKANREIEKELSKFFKTRVAVVSGYTSTRKHILIYGKTLENVRKTMLNFEGK